MLVRPAVMASVGRCSSIGIETTLTAKISVAKSAPSSTQAMMKLMFSGSSSASSEPLKSGMPSKVTAKTTSVARAQTISSTSSTKPKMASWPVRVCQASSESPQSTFSPFSSRWLVRYMPRHSAGPVSRKPPDSPST